MLIKNGQRLYDERDVRAYAQGYWDGRFHGEKVKRKKLAPACLYSYDAGYTHGEFDYAEDNNHGDPIDALEPWDMAMLDRLTIINPPAAHDD